MPTFGTPITNQHSVSLYKILTKDKIKTQLEKKIKIIDKQEMLI
jgi:hypothetical protein